MTEVVLRTVTIQLFCSFVGIGRRTSPYCQWFITQCERTGVPEHFTATLVGHHSARSANKLTYGLYSAGISDAQKREILEGVRIPRR